MPEPHPPLPDVQGKVRDIYDLGDSLLLVASDRISAFDIILPTAIPHKGKVLTRLSLFWFEVLGDIAQNHLITAELECLPPHLAPFERSFRGRAMIVRKATVFPVECIVRGYLAGSAWEEYRRYGAVSGNALPPGLLESSRLPTPLFTPTTKAQVGSRDEGIRFDRMCETLGADIATELRRISLRLYERASAHALDHGIIVADTKFEFGLIDDSVTLIDEVLTPDSSRYWPAAEYAPGRAQRSFDKQYVRDWLKASGWNGATPVPELPFEVSQGTSERYIEAYERLTGRGFEPKGG